MSLTSNDPLPKNRSNPFFPLEQNLLFRAKNGYVVEILLVYPYNNNNKTPISQRVCMYFLHPEPSQKNNNIKLMPNRVFARTN